MIESHKNSVLIVDDETVNIAALTQILQPEYTVYAAQSGAAAVEAAKKFLPEVILLDIIMPEMDGYAVISTLKESETTRNIPVIFVTELNDSGDEEKGLALGASEYITKPFSPALVKLRVRNQIALIEQFRSDVLSREMVENLRQFRLRHTANETKPQITHEPMPYGSVLVVDDTEMSLYVAARLLKLYKLQVDTVTSGSEAIDKIKGGKVYDIVFMDHMMPKMDGIETTKHLRDLGYSRPIVALTANATADQADIFLRNGFDAFVAKPIDTQDLNAVLNKLIRDKQPANVTEAARRQMSAAEADGGGTDSPILNKVNKEISGLNMDKGLKKFGGEKTYLKVLRRYAAGIRSLLGSLEIVGEDNRLDYKITVHGIKGSSFDIFAAQIGKKARDLEKAADAGDFKYINEHNPVFLETAWKLVNDLEDMFHAIDTQNPKPKKDKPDAQVLSKLRAACEVYSMNGVDAAMEEIDGYEYESDDGLVNWLRENVDTMNFAQIAEKLSGFRQ